jgi:D-serine deaminase-like pyridoxal phosphate-dependent protein
MNLQKIPTPAFFIDLPVLKKNLGFMKSRAATLGVNLRPHVKTHKTREIALMQMDSTRSITVSTLAEAEFFLQAGITDITYAVPVFPDKLDRISRLIQQGADLKILVDHPSVPGFLEKKSKENKIRFKTLIKIDCGYGRAGLHAQSEDAFRLAFDIHRSKYLSLQGILTHAGQSYACRNTQEIRQIASDEQKSVVSFSVKIMGAGIPCPVVSIGSTPTASHAENLDGVTEIRPGCYAFFDKFQADIGTCSLKNCAASILAGIIGVYPERNQFMVDAGALALSKDEGAAHLDQLKTFGIVRENRNLFVSSISQEIGIISGTEPIDFSLFRIGKKVSIIPNHCCLAASLFPEYYVMEGQDITGIWKPVKGW